MTTYMTKKLKLGAILAAMAMCLAGNVYSADLAGNVIRVKGDVSAKSDEMRTLGAGDVIMEGDTIITGETSGIQVQMKDGAIIALAADSSLTISSYNFNEPDGQKDGIKLLLKQGSMRTITGDTDKDSYILETPSSIIRIQGTVFDTQANDKNTVVILREGAVITESTCEGAPSGSTRLIDVPGMASSLVPCEDPDLQDGYAIAALDGILALDTAAGASGGASAPAAPAPPASGNSSP